MAVAALTTVIGKETSDDVNAWSWSCVGRLNPIEIATCEPTGRVGAPQRQAGTPAVAAAAVTATGAGAAATEAGAVQA
jgi:hypothetical protein